jgi:hypothetical protein
LTCWPISASAARLWLWYIDLTGNDCGDLRRQTIHSLSGVIRTLEQAAGDEIRAVVGTPTRQSQEIYRAIEGDRQIVARLGRSLAHWQRFRQDLCMLSINRPAPV